LFLGTYTVELDQQDRLSMPAAYGLEPSRVLFVMQGFERNLMILTARSFESLSGRLGSLNIADPAARLLLRLSFGSACEVRVDDDGAIAVPQPLREHAGLSGHLKVIGLGDYCEVWSGKHWAEQQALLDDAEANAKRFSTLMVMTR